MKKHFFLLSLLLSFTIGIGQMWATAISVTTNPTTSGTFTITAAKGSGQNAPIESTKCVRLYANNTLTISTSGSANITEMTIAWTKNGSKAFASVTTETGSYTHPSAAGNGTWTGSAKEIVFNVGTSGQIQITSVDITVEEGGSSKTTITDEQLAWSAASATVTMDATDNVFPSLTNSIPVSVTYQSTDETVATISNTGVVSILKAGSTTIKAVFAEDETYNAKTVQYTLTVNPAPLTPIEGGIVDELVISDLLTSGSGYQAFSGKQASNEGHSDAVYAGKVCISSTNIQMNSIGSSNAGREIATTTSGGNAKRVEVIWGGTNVANRTLTVYGSTTAYSGEETASSGTSLGVITYTANAVSNHIDITGNYPYIQLLASGAMYFAKINITWVEAVAPAVAVPTISGDENFVSSTTVTLDCETEGADIYYTTNGEAPTSSSTHYTAPFTLNATATVKAIAIKGGISSEVATKDFTKIEALTTMDAIFTAATAAGNTATDKYVTFDNWVVSAVSGSNAFVTDGTKGFIIYASNHGFAVGNVLSGTAACKVQLYKGSAELTNLTNSTTGLTVTTGGTSATNTKTIDQLGAINTGAVVTIENVTFDGTNLSDGTNTIKPYNKLFAYTMESGKVYNVTGVIDYYDALQIMPRSAADVEEIVEEGAPETPTFSPAAGTYTSVQSVEISCATEGAAIYYTTNGSTPTSASTQYTTAISVGETMTIKAIAIKNEQSSAMATAAYTINLPEDEETSKTWDLSAASYDGTPTEDLIQWSGTYVTMTNAKGTSTTSVTNFIPATKSSTRFYKNNVLTLTPSGKQITKIEFLATSTSYATALQSSTWTNGVATVASTLVTVTVSKKGAVSATIGGTCGFTSVKVYYTDIDDSVPDDPTFSPVAGTYTEVQSVEISCTTEGATIYYTTDGTVPSQESTEYTEAISVGEDMTIKAIAIKDGKSSAVATATYAINLPENEETSKTWDLSTDQTATATTSEMTWTATYVSMSLAKGSSSTNANNAYPGSATPQDHTRIYKDQVLTITPNNKQITKVEIVTTYSTASTLASSTWSNATAQELSSIVTVTPLSGTNAISATITGACRLTSVKVSYTAIDESIPVNPTFSPAAGTYTSAQNVEISTTTEGATIYYTTDGSTPTSESTEYTTALTVGEDMTIKAIAIKDSKSSGVVTAEYTINIPELPEGCDGADDFITATNTSASSYDVERTTTNGWTSVNAALTTISEEACWLTINGKTSAVGVITSPTLNNGISSLKVRYANTFTEANGVSIKVEIKQGETTAKEYTITKENADVTKGTVYTETIENINVAGDFQIVITNLSPSNYSSGNKDRVSIGKLCWTNYSAPADPELIWTDARTGLTEGNYYTICYPKAMTAIRGGLLFSLGGLETNSVYLVQKDAPFVAGRPYILYATAEKLEAVVEGDDAPAGSYNGLYGTLSPMSAAALDAAGATYMLYNNSIRAIGTNNSLAAGRAYIILNEIPGGAPSGQAPGRVRRMPMQGNVATDIEANGLTDKPTKVMIDGQLFILRNESMYDMTGRPVK